MYEKKRPNHAYLRKAIDRFYLMLKLMRLPERRLVRGSFPEYGEDLGVARQEIRDRIEEKYELEKIFCKKEPRGLFDLRSLAAQLALSPVEMDLYLLRLALERYPRFEHYCAEETSDAYPLPSARKFLHDLLFQYHGDDALNAFEETGPLFASGLIRYVSESAGLRINDLTRLNYTAAAMLMGEQLPLPDFSVKRPDEQQAPQRQESYHLN